MNHTRQGTFLLLCIALSALVVILAFAFVRILGWQRDASQTNQHMLLAQQAAREGVAHAMEQILLDVAAPTITVATGSGTVDVDAPTFLDGPFRAPFNSLYAPNNTKEWIDRNTTAMDNDIRPEHSMMFPWMRYDGGAHLNQIWHPGGMQVYDGRGRYYEPSYYNVRRAVTGNDPVAPTPFTDLTAALPERRDGMFFDEDLRPIDSGDPVKDRQAARYRMRYAVGVEDLAGHLLINPDARMALPAGYRTPPQWIRRGTDAFGAIMQSMLGTGPWMTHYEHLFMGRGWFTNVDRDSATGAPVTFPFMYRCAIPGPAYPGDVPADRQPWSKASWGGELPADFYGSSYTAPGARGGRPIWSNRDVTFQWDQWRVMWDTALYNDPYHYDDANQQGRFSNAQLGPQLSWSGLHYAFDGASTDLQAGFKGDYNLLMNNLTLTPYGQAQRIPARYPGSDPFSSSGSRAGLKWYEGRVDTPWHVNLLTSTLWGLKGLVHALRPLSYDAPPFTKGHFYRFDYTTNPGGDQVQVGGDFPLKIEDLGGVPVGGLGRDLHVATANVDHSQLASEAAPVAFNDPAVIFQYPPPQRPAAGGEPVSYPDYYVRDPTSRTTASEPRALLNTYPGRLWSGDPEQADQGLDDLGRYINTDDGRSDIPDPSDPSRTITVCGLMPRVYDFGSNRCCGWDTWTGSYINIVSPNPNTRDVNLRDCIRGGLITFKKNTYKPDGSFDAVVDFQAAASDVLALMATVPNAYENWSQSNYELCWDFTPLAILSGTVPDIWWARSPEATGPNAGLHLPDYRNFFRKEAETLSYWGDVEASFCHSAAIVRDQWMMYNGNGTADGVFAPRDRDPSKHRTLRDLDRLFLAHLGESLERPNQRKRPSELDLTVYNIPYFGNNRSGDQNFGMIYYQYRQPYAGNPLGSWADYYPKHNIWSLRADHLLTPFSSVPVTRDTDFDKGYEARRAATMELVLNDFRMSVMGSSPEYSDPLKFDASGNPSLDPDNEFRPLDFDGNGFAACSCYPDPDPTFNSDVDLTKNIRIPAAPADLVTGRGPKPDKERYFSLSGNFYIGKSHYFRVLTRGELYDNRTNTVIQDAQLESVFAVDPEARAYARKQGQPITGMQMLYQRWMYDKYAGQLSRIRR